MVCVAIDSFALGPKCPDFYEGNGTATIFFTALPKWGQLCQRGARRDKWFFNTCA